MRSLLAAALLLGACSEDPGHRPIQPGTGGFVGSGGSGGVGGSGGGGTGGSGGAVVSGTVCVRGIDPSTICQQVSFGGATVAIAGAAATTPVASDGTFQVDASGQTTAIVEFVQSTSSIVRAAATTVVPGNLTLHTIPDSLRQDFLSQSMLPQAVDSSWVMAYAVDGNGIPQSGIRVQGGPLSQDVWYDDGARGTNQISNTAAHTGQYGLAVFPNALPGTRLQFNFVPPSTAGPPVAVSVDVVNRDLTVVLVRVL